jgi:hypothetical protein
LKAINKKKMFKCSIANSIKPMCWRKRDKPELNIALIYYGGDSMKMEDLERIEPLLKDRFYKATDGALSLNIMTKKILPFKQKMPVGYTYKNITDPKRLQRIWYIENVDGRVLTEIYEEYKKVENPETIHNIDVVLTISSAPFNAIGLANGRVSATKYPVEAGYGLPDGGEVIYPSDYAIVDEFIHELGHNMFLGHTSSPCMSHIIKKKLGFTEYTEELFREVDRCCEQSPSKNDALSYCRKRAKVSENFMHGYESCNLDMIKNKIVPNMLNGGAWNIPNRSQCL